jgi:hypothetical protein
MSVLGLTLAVPLVPATATAPSLQGEQLSTPDDPIFDQGAGPSNPPGCDPATASTVSYSGKGPVFAGPYPGTMFFSGSYSIGPQQWSTSPLSGPLTSDPIFGFPADYGELTSFTGTFSVVDNGITTVTGTFALAPRPSFGGVNIGSCYAKGPGDWLGYTGVSSGALIAVDTRVSYVATIDGQQLTGTGAFRQRQICIDTTGYCSRTNFTNNLFSPSLPFDATPPALSPTVNPNPVLQGGSAAADPGASDPETGITASSCDPVDTSTPGTFSVSCTATNGAGLTSSASASYQVLPPPVSVSVSTTGTGGGVVTSQPAGISCGLTCTAQFDAGSPVQLTAVADSGSAFAGWSGDCSGLNAVCTLTAAQGRSATAAFATVTTNHPPVANAATETTPEDTPSAITLTGSDPDGDPLTFVIGAKPAHGSLTGSAPNLTYTPDADFNGADAFMFTVNDGTFSSVPGSVSITVSPVNDPPVPKAQAVVLNEDTTKNIVLKATDVDGDPLTYKLTQTPNWGFATGVAPALVYQPYDNYNGPDALTFSVSDGRLQSSAAVSITVKPVNDVPHVTVWNFAATEGKLAGPFEVATFSDPDHQAASTYTATIRWGDGTSSEGKLKYLANFGVYDVIGSHTYKHCGTYKITVIVVDDNGGTGRDTVSERCNDAQATAYNGTGTATRAVKFTFPVSSLVDSNPYATKGDWSATINWGDGSAVSTATIKNNYAGSNWTGDFLAVGSHTFTKTGTFRTRVTWTSDCGLSVTTTITWTVR